MRKEPAQSEQALSTIALHLVCRVKLSPIILIEIEL